MPAAPLREVNYSLINVTDWLKGLVHIKTDILTLVDRQNIFFPVLDKIIDSGEDWKPLALGANTNNWPCHGSEDYLWAKECTPCRVCHGAAVIRGHSKR